MKDSDWEILYRLYKTPNITKVANMLYISQPSLTRRLKGIEEEFNIRRSSVTSVLQLLEKKGYIKRVSVKDDKRLKKIILTGTGKLIQEKVHSLIQEGEQKLKDELTEEELKIFMDILLRLSKKLGWFWFYIVRSLTKGDEENDKKIIWVH